MQPTLVHSKLAIFKFDGLLVVTQQAAPQKKQKH